MPGWQCGRARPPPEKVKLGTAAPWRQAPACATVNKPTPCDIDRFGTASRMRDGRARCARAYCQSPWARGGWPTSGRKKNRCGTYSRHRTYSSVIAADIIQRALPAKPFLGGAGQGCAQPCCQPCCQGWRPVMTVSLLVNLLARLGGQSWHPVWLGVAYGLAFSLAWRPGWAISLADVPAL